MYDVNIYAVGIPITIKSVIHACATVIIVYSIDDANDIFDGKIITDSYHSTGEWKGMDVCVCGAHS